MSFYTELETRRERRINARLWAEAARQRGMNVALTLNPDCYLPGRTLAEPFIDGLCRKLFRDLNRELHGLSRKEAETITRLDFLGVYELHDRRGSFYPHAHLAIRLDPMEERQLELFLRTRWGARDGPAGRRVHTPAYHKPLVTHSGSCPEFWITPVHNTEGWMKYITKQTDHHTKLILPDQYINLNLN